MTHHEPDSELYLALHERHPEYSPEVIKRQIELEELMRAEGALRYQRMLEKTRESGSESTTPHGRTLLEHFTRSLSSHIASVFEETLENGRPGFNNSSLKKIEGLGYDTIAFLALKGVLNTVIQRPTLPHVAAEISTLLEDEAKCNHFEKHAPEAYRFAMKRASESTTYARKHAALSAMMTHTANGDYGNDPDEALKWKSWGASIRQQIGVKLVFLIRDWLRFIRVEKRSLGKTGKRGRQTTWSRYCVEPEPELLTWIDEHVARTGALRPLLLPSVIPPRDYTTPFNGAYHTKRLPLHPLVKTRHRKHKDLLRSHIDAMRSVYDAVNTAQATGWRVNGRVLAIAKALWEKGVVMPGLPRQEQEPMPRCSRCGREVTEDGREQRHPCFEEKEALTQWKKVAHETHRRNSALFSKRLQVHNIFWTANLLATDPAFYFPCQLDFRGRLYTIPQGLTPQGCDLAKGLLEFATGKPIETQEAEDWLAIHAANTWGKDKVSFGERIAWTHENAPLFERIAKDPIEHINDWKDAGDPFSFLAACLDWTNYQRVGRGYISRLPIAQDGTCSGLQHFSAMLRDPEGAKATNLLPSDAPQDIYRVVAERTVEKLEAVEVTSPHYHTARRWLCSNLIDRSLAKGPVMTLPYGATASGMLEQIIACVEEKRERTSQAFSWSPEELPQACRYLTLVVRSTIEEVVTAAPRAMTWLQEVAAIVSKTNQPLIWTTPTGMPVVQE